MKGVFYPKLAMVSIRNNKRLYLPYILTSIGIVMTFYILDFVARSTVVSNIPGGSSMQAILLLGSYVIGFFSVLFLFYTNSFLTKRRKKEFGLYNILGMNKKNIARVLLWETIIIGSISLCAGLFFGILLSKMAELCLLNLMRQPINMMFHVSALAVSHTVVLFLGIDLLLLITNIIQVGKNNAINLFRSESVGEKKLKGNGFFAITGAVILIAAYYIAITIKSPIDAMSWFFVAVIMVIVASNILFISGSVFICKLLKKKKSFYYKPNHFVAVSSMAYRMKRNGAGLANICILSTMVLVMISTTFSLYIGVEDSLKERYPKEYNFYAEASAEDQLTSEFITAERTYFNQLLEKEDITPRSMIDYRCASIACMLVDDTFKCDVSEVKGTDEFDYNMAYMVSFIPQEDYNRYAKEKVSLKKGEVLLFEEKGHYHYSELKFPGGQYCVVGSLDEFPIEGINGMDIVNCIDVVVCDMDDVISVFEKEISMLNLDYQLGVDIEDVEIKSEVMERIAKQFQDKMIEDGIKYTRCDNREQNRQEFFNIYSGLFFIGILLSVVFTVAVALIIYYKQITEGYEDQARFGIMKKVGMTKREIKKSINSQLLIVFFLPLVGAACHLSFAFPMINKLLNIFGLYNITLFAASCAVCFVIFALLYVVIYKMTSNAYLAIVNE